MGLYHHLKYKTVEHHHGIRTTKTGEVTRSKHPRHEPVLDTQRRTKNERRRRPRKNEESGGKRELNQGKTQVVSQRSKGLDLRNVKENGNR